ncbi:group III truncated hemoglobin [Mongoliitalea daihaiensis]|uniref:group III truncated hemoglobin n=1 Tax=Mongoliitalea daihaiensis TaxID=2782006 RepID=UPI001F432A5D|nr:group III truncated hemoglobin [Mongoliitalea daihaiensis]UJP65416.1 group III truncated hemoglobin [Mongoliitalea daihaiensis]
MKRQLTNREDVQFLVNSFYAQVREDATLGRIFNRIVQDWPTHLEHLGDFWEMVLLQSGPGAGKFSPVPVHKEVDRTMNHQLQQAHFEHWLGLWFGTVDAYFEGEVADYAKEHAGRMAHILFFRIMEGRLQD